jgi:hypothetical protein
VISSWLELAPVPAALLQDHILETERLCLAFMEIRKQVSERARE